MGGNLLWAYSFKESLHVMEVGEDNWELVAVIGMDITLLHVLQVLLIVTLTIFSGVLRFVTI